MLEHQNAIDEIAKKIPESLSPRQVDVETQDYNIVRKTFQNLLNP